MMLIFVCPMCSIISINCFLAVLISKQFSFKLLFDQMSARSCVCQKFVFWSFFFRPFVFSAESLSNLCLSSQMSFGKMSFRSHVFRSYVHLVICLAAIRPPTVWVGAITYMNACAFKLLLRVSECHCHSDVSAVSLAQCTHKHGQTLIDTLYRCQGTDSKKLRL